MTKIQLKFYLKKVNLIFPFVCLKSNLHCRPCVSPGTRPIPSTAMFEILEREKTEISLSRLSASNSSVNHESSSTLSLHLNKSPMTRPTILSEYIHKYSFYPLRKKEKAEWYFCICGFFHFIQRWWVKECRLNEASGEKGMNTTHLILSGCDVEFFNIHIEHRALMDFA